MSALNDRLATVRQRWAGLAPREKTLVLLAAAVVLLGVLWWVALAPAIATLRSAPAQHQELDAQLQRMRGLQAQAQALQSQPKLNPDDALRVLETSVRQQLGSTARVSAGGDRVTITVNSARGDALAQWLAQARVNARALPAEARLNRNAGGLWDGTVVLVLPAR